ncbi:MFS transporter [Ottowia caeni]|uniref:MFS transporter n=1 Tax=Ottowia caeni TaxID=2870339 RepID=UPI001E31590D|nr:MFS transporter [Ottowia caeni]
MSKAHNPTEGENSLSRTQRLSFICVLTGAALSVLDSTAIALASPSIAKEFDVPPSNVVLMMNAFQIAVLAMLLPLGIIGERVGYRKIYLFGLTLFSISSTLAFFTDSLITLLIARVFQGIGAAGMMSVTTALVRLIFSDAKLGKGLSTNSMVVAVASVAGPLFTASVLSMGSWRWIFALNAAIGIAAIAMALVSLPRNPHQQERRSSATSFGIGFILNAVTFTLIFVGANSLALGENVVNVSSAGWLTLGVGGVVACLYIWHQSRVSHPILPLDVLKIPQVSRTLGASVCAYCALTIAHLGLPFLLLETYKISTFETSFLLTGWPIAVVLVAPFAGRLIGRYPNGLLSSGGMLFLAMGLFSLALTPSEITNFDPFWRIILCGAGFALFQPPNYHSIITCTPSERSGAGSAMISVARLMGQAVGGTLLATTYALCADQKGAAEMIGMLVACGFALLAGVLSFLTPKATSHLGTASS